MKLKKRIVDEAHKLPLIAKGYSRSMANAWLRATESDKRKYRKKYSKKTIQQLHDRGYLCSSVSRYHLLDENAATEYITDFEYMLLKPFNNSYTKWIEDIITTNRVLKHKAEHCRNVYYSLIRREGNTMILRVDHEDREYTVEDMLETIREKGVLELRPAQWSSERNRYTVEYRDEQLFINDEPSSERIFGNIVKKLIANYVLAEKVSIRFVLPTGEALDHYLKFWIANDSEEGSKILFSVMNFYWNEGFKSSRKHCCVPVDLETGHADFEGMDVAIPGWEQIKEQILSISEEMKPLNFYTCNIALQEDAPFQLLSFSGSPKLPDMAYGEKLNSYLKAKVAVRKNQPKTKFTTRCKHMKDLVVDRMIMKFCRKGIRPYMQKLWMNSVKSDFLNTKDVSLGKKIWCWKRGFMSYRTYQYGLTEENYTKFLSDYDYHYLNRINNSYQKWINDKTTTRFILEPFKKFFPSYYFLLFKRGGKSDIMRMWDCPEGIENSYDGLFQMLREKGRLAMKPSAGTHGDGFYCLSFENDAFCVNGEVKTEEEIIALIQTFKSFYIVTEYIEMHTALKKIYPKSVNTIRMMVINRHGYDPKIMQTYMRIGSSRTGFTDNVGYGGICVMVDKETGELYQPETIKDHKFYDCPNHPDTGTPIAGFLPNWDIVRENVLAVSRYLCELEYLGFDIAITEEGFCLLEINIHQDLHKVAKLDEEVLEFYRQKLAYKKKLNKVK